MSVYVVALAENIYLNVSVYVVALVENIYLNVSVYVLIFNTYKQPVLCN